MNPSEPASARAGLRSWLRDAIRFGLLDRLPTEYRRVGSDHRVKTSPYARALLANLSGPSARPIRDVVADAAAFRDWAEDRLRAVRGRIMAESPGPWVEPLSDEVVSAGLMRNDRPAPRPRADPNRHPLYDRWMDG